MTSHRDMYPEQYAHSLVDKYVRTEDGRIVRVERIMSTRFGLLASIKDASPLVAYSVDTLTLIGDAIFSATAVECPTHGRMNSVITTADHRLLCRVCGAETRSTAKPELRRGVFVADWLADGDSYEGWTDGDNWNGWACPLFERDEAERLAEYLNSVGEGITPIVFDGYNFVTIHDADEGYPDDERWEPWPTIVRDGKTLYGIGAWCWTWDEADDATVEHVDDDVRSFGPHVKICTVCDENVPATTVRDGTPCCETCADAFDEHDGPGDVGMPERD